MKFQKGDIVKGIADKEYGIVDTAMTKGKVVEIVRDRIAIEVLEHSDKIWVGEIFYGLKPKYFELLETKNALEKVTNPKNLIPLIAKELGVEIGEEFEIVGWSSYRHRFTNKQLEICLHEWTEVDNETYRQVFVYNVKIRKRPKTYN